MGTIVAQATGNFSAGATWTGGVKPGASDTAQTGAYTVTIDEDVTCVSLEATSSGHYEVTAGGRTINANFVMASSYATNGGLRCTHNSGTVTLNGTISGTSGTVAVGNNGTGTFTVVGASVVAPPSANARGINNASTGIVNITADVTGGAGTNGRGVNNASGTVNITGNVTAGAGGSAHGAYNVGTSPTTIVITGNVAGAGGSLACGVVNANTGTVTVSGTATGGSVAGSYGAQNLLTGTLTVDLAVGGTNETAQGLYGVVSGGTTTFKRIGSAANGLTALGGFCKISTDIDVNTATFIDATDGSDVVLLQSNAVGPIYGGFVHRRA